MVTHLRYYCKISKQGGGEVVVDHFSNNTISNRRRSPSVETNFFYFWTWPAKSSALSAKARDARDEEDDDIKNTPVASQM